MATWLPENSMLTQKGIEILNKIKAGNGKITITKIVAGSSRVSPSQLSSLTGVSGTHRQMIISNKSVRASGSEISVYISNENFTEPFSLHQIGVYVSHPDYPEEQLYHISQCESTNVDIIPTATDTPATFGYSLFLEHGNSSSVEITIDPRGMVTADRFNNFVKNIVSNHLVVADDDGNLKDAGKSVSELCNPNLLTNSYFANPVHRKNGYVVPPNTPYYSDPALTTLVANTTSYVQVSKVKDTYGTFVLNNTLYYVPWNLAVRGYTGLGVSIDRWRVTSGANTYALLDNKGVRFGNTGSESCTIRQYTTLTPSQAIGYKFTLSVLTADGRFFTTTTPTEYDGSINWNLADVEMDGVKFYVVSNSTDFFGVQFYVSPSKELNIQAVKLEIGTQQTLVHQDANGKWVLNEIPNFAEESAKCSQYSYTNDEYLGDIPYGYIEEDIYVSSAEELDARLELIYNSMPNSRVKYVQVAFSASHPILGGSNRIMQIFRSNHQYGAIKAFSYASNTDGVTLEHTRSRFNGVWTNWARTYNSYFKPTLTELGAAPSGYGLGDRAVVQATDTSALDTLNKSGWYSVAFGGSTEIITGYNGVYLRVRVDAYEPENLTQTAKFINNLHTIQRNKVKNVWEPWKWVNPPLATGVEYLTTEFFQGVAVVKKVDSNGNLLWRKENETGWRVMFSASNVVPASVE